MKSVRKSHTKIIVIGYCCIILFATLAFSSAPPNQNAETYSSGWKRPTFPPLGWYALPNKGLNGGVRAFAVTGSDLYAGGYFTATGDAGLTNLGRIGRYNTSSKSWHALSNEGLNGAVLALTVHGDDLYVGGSFSATGDGTLPNLSNIARYDTKNSTWHEMPNEGLNSVVRAMVVHGDDLYVAGTFFETGDGTLKDIGRIVRFDTNTKTWHKLPKQGLNHWVYSLALSGDNLYAGGQFTATGDGSTWTDLGHIVRYNITAKTWQPLPNKGLDDDVIALKASGEYLYAGGDFLETGDGDLEKLGRIARYNSNSDTWETFPNKGLNNRIWALEISGDDLYVGGEFVAAGDGTLTDLNRIARYNLVSGDWHPLLSNGVTDDVYALKFFKSDLYVGGAFLATKGTGLIPILNYIARLALDVPDFNGYLPLVFKR